MDKRRTEIPPYYARNIHFDKQKHTKTNRIFIVSENKEANTATGKIVHIPRVETTTEGNIFVCIYKSPCSALNI